MRSIKCDKCGKEMYDKDEKRDHGISLWTVLSMMRIWGERERLEIPKGSFLEGQFGKLSKKVDGEICYECFLKVLIGEDI